MLERLISPDILIPFFVFGMPVAVVWLKMHYKALERGHIAANGALPASERVRQLEAQNKDLLERVQNLESIVVALDEAPKQKTLKAKSET